MNDVFFKSAALLAATLFVGCSGSPVSESSPDAGARVDGGAAALVPDASSGKADQTGDAGLSELDDFGTDPLVVRTERGLVRGRRHGDVFGFHGIPFAAPPVEGFRWAPPQRVPEWDGVRDATVPGPVCPQLTSWIEAPPACSTCEDDACRERCQDEDCLTANVWTTATDGAKPVMVWFHGGSNVSGAGSFYDAEALAERGDVVVVTANYRLGPLGMLALPEMRIGENHGFQDQVAVLQWVRREIDRFGGDPERVTVFGESAGGTAVCELVTSPRGGALVDRAIMQSGLCASVMRPWKDSRILCPDLGRICPSLEEIEAEQTWACLSAECLSERLGDALGCTEEPRLECMREKSAVEVLQGLPQSIGFDPSGVVWTRFVDLVDIPQPPAWALQSGDFPPVDFMMGTTEDEATLFHFPSESPVTTLDEFRSVTAAWGECADELEAAYPQAATDPVAAYMQMVGDQWYTCPTNLAAGWSAAKSDVYLYRFTHVPWAGRQDYGVGYQLGAYHSAELPYVFGSLASPRNDESCDVDAAGDFHCCDDAGRCFGAEDVELSDAMIAAWSSFAATGTPAGWSAFAAGSHVAIEPGLPEVEGVPGAARCAVWEGVWEHTFVAPGYCQ